MNNTTLTIAAVIAFCTQAPAVDIKAITGKPTASDPRFGDKEAWPMLVGDEYFAKEKWPKARLLIWNATAKTSTGGKRPREVCDPKNPANWIDAATGKPADAPPDRETDVILPDAPTPYRVAAAKGESNACRHLTIGRNATLSMEVGHNFSIFGNLWVRHGGTLRCWRGTIFAGNRDTFLRQDWPEDGKLKKMHDERLVTPFDPDPKAKNPWMQDGRPNRSIAVYLVHDKEAGKSTEIIGYVRSLDEVGIKSGTLIVGRDSRFVSMGPATVAVRRGAKVVLMDGAMCSHGKNQIPCGDWGVAAGAEVTGGTPDRPLKRDAYFGLGYRNWQNLPIPESETCNGKHGKRRESAPGETAIYYGYKGYNAAIEGNLTGYPAPGSDARLVVCWQRIAFGGAGNWGRSDEAFLKVFPRIPPKIGLWIGADSMLENVRFDDLRLGGIVTESIETFRRWKNISFGDGCLSNDPEDLVREYRAELPGERVHSTTILAPKKPYTTMPGK